MPIRPKEACLSDLSAFFPIFHDAVVSGNSRFWELHSEQAHILRCGSRASIVRDYIAQHLRGRLEGTRGVVIKEINQTTYFCIGDWTLIIHKIKENGTIAVNRTNLSLSLNDNNPEPTFSDFPDDTTVLHLGYREIIASHLEPEVLIACPNGAKPAWTLDIKRPDSLPPIEITPTKDTPEPKRVRIIKQEEKKNWGA